MVRVVPYAGVSFMTYPKYEAAARRAAERIRGGFVGEPGDAMRAENVSGTSGSVGTRFLAGSAAGATATAMTYPLDLMRARYAAAGAVPSLAGGSVSEKSVGFLFRDLAHIFQTRGARGLYGGVAPTLLGIVPYAGISFATFETLKSRYGVRGDGAGRDARDAGTDRISVPTRLFFGGVAGALAQTATYPLDIVRRRIQVVGKAGGYVSSWDALRSIAEKEGLRGGLYKGVTMNWLKGPIAVAVAFFVNDAVKAHFRERRGEESDAEVGHEKDT